MIIGIIGAFDEETEKFIDMFNLVKDDYDENLDDVMKSVNKLLNNYGYEIDTKEEKESE